MHGEYSRPTPRSAMHRACRAHPGDRRHAPGRPGPSQARPCGCQVALWPRPAPPAPRRVRPVVAWACRALTAPQGRVAATAGGGGRPTRDTSPGAVRGRAAGIAPVRGGRPAAPGLVVPAAPSTRPRDTPRPPASPDTSGPPCAQRGHTRPAPSRSAWPRRATVPGRSYPGGADTLAVPPAWCQRRAQGIAACPRWRCRAAARAGHGPRRDVRGAGVTSRVVSARAGRSLVVRHPPDAAADDAPHAPGHIRRAGATTAGDGTPAGKRSRGQHEPRASQRLRCAIERGAPAHRASPAHRGSQAHRRASRARYTRVWGTPHPGTPRRGWDSRPGTGRPEGTARPRRTAQTPQGEVNPRRWASRTAAAAHAGNQSNECASLGGEDVPNRGGSPHGGITPTTARAERAEPACGGDRRIREHSPRRGIAEPGWASLPGAGWSAGGKRWNDCPNLTREYANPSEESGKPFHWPREMQHLSGGASQAGNPVEPVGHLFEAQPSSGDHQPPIQVNQRDYLSPDRHGRDTVPNDAPDRRTVAPPKPHTPEAAYPGSVAKNTAFKAHHHAKRVKRAGVGVAAGNSPRQHAISRPRPAFAPPTC